MTRKWLRIGAVMLVVALLGGCARQPEKTITLMDQAVPLSAGATDPASDIALEGETPKEASADATAVPLDDAFVAPAQPSADAAPAQAISPAQQARSAAKHDEDADLYLGVITQDDSAIHPLRCTQRDFYSINALVFESMVELDDALKPTPLLADRWTVEGDVWTFRLRSGIQFHNGALLGAADVVESYNMIKANPNTLWYPLLDVVESMRMVDDLTVEVVAKDIGEILLYAMTFPVIQRGTLSSGLPKGTGPFWYIEYSVGEHVRIESNPLWWKRSTDDVHTIVARCYRSTVEALAAVENGGIDAFATRSTSAALSRSLSDRMTMDYSTQTYECVVPNLQNTVLANLPVREALMYAIDRTSLAESAYLGMVQESEVPVTPGSWIYDAQATKYNYSPERALQILYDDGWADRNSDGVLEKELNGLNVEFRMTIITYNEGTSPVRTEAARAIADQLRRVGISVEVQTMTLEEVEKQMTNGDFQLALVSYNMSQMPNLSFMLASSGSMNYSKYQNSTMDELLRTARTAKTETEFADVMSKIQLSVVNDLPILGLFFRNGVLVSKKSIGGLHGLREGGALRGLEQSTIQ